jgi:hypothetical protein
MHKVTLTANALGERRAQENRPRECGDCQHFDYGVCHKLARMSEPCETCANWEQRLEHGGMTIWDSLAREG